jgi:hypothetical protein
MILILAGIAFLYRSPIAHADAEPPRVESLREAQALRELAPIAKRAGKTLSLSLKRRGSVHFETVDTCSGPDDCEAYYLMGLSPDRQFFVVKQRLWEGDNVFWVSRSNGVKYEMYAEPHVSPDGKNIVTAIPSEAYGINGVFLWEIRDGMLTKRFHFEPTEYALYSFVRWLGPAAVELKKFTRADAAVCAGRQYMEVSVRLVRKGAHWSLDENLDPAVVACR